MRILVCVKEVLDPECTLRVDPGGKAVATDASALYRLNRFDEFAVEAALLIKGNIEDTSVDAVTVGPERSMAVIRRAIGMGVDEGFHILAEEGGLQTPFVVASCIAAWAAERAYDLILAGVMAEDDMEGQVGQWVASILDMPCATSVIQVRILEGGAGADVEREIEGGLRHSVALSFPCLLTLQSGINRPRYPSLSNVLRARKQVIHAVAMSALGAPDARQEIVRMGEPQKTRSGVFLTGAAERKASTLAEILRKKGFFG